MSALTGKMAKSIGVGSRMPQLAKGQALNFNHSIPIVIEDAQVDRQEGFVRPTGGVSGNGPFELVLPAVHDSYLMLGNLSLYVKLKITDGKGETMDDFALDLAAPINCLGLGLWEHVEVSLNDYIINSGSASNAHYKGFIETMLSYNAQGTAKSDSMSTTHLRAQMCYMDTPGHYNTMAKGGANKGWIKRAEIVKKSAVFDMMGSVTADFLRADKHLAPGNKLSLKLYKARDSFLVNSAVANADYEVKISDIKLFYQRIRLKDSIAPPTIERYLFNRTELKRFPVPSGMTSFNFTLHHGGKMPKSVIVTQVATVAAEGSYAENPFYLQHFNVNYLCLKVNGQRLPSEPYKPNFSATPLLAREYLSMFMNTGRYRVDEGNSISMDAFANGLTIFPFDLNSDMCNGAHLHAAREGNIDLEIGWSTALPKAATILVHCTYDEVISRKRNDTEGYTSESI